MPEARELTPRGDEPRWLRSLLRNIRKKIRPEGMKDTSRRDEIQRKRIVNRRGKQLSKAGLVTGVKS